MHFIFKGDIITATPTSSKSSGELGKNEKSSIEDMDYYYRAESANEIISNKDDHVEEETTVDTYLDQALNRGALLRQWKLLAEAELQAAEEEEKKEEEDIVQIDEDYTIDFKEENDSKTKPVKVLRYNQYLQHQRYHDDYKQVNYKFIDFGNVTDPTSDYNKLVIQQDRSLGKGGLIWDAAFCLGEYLMFHHSDLLKNKSILELGAGTGMLGCWLAKALHNQGCHIVATDLPLLSDLMKKNIELNFSTMKSTPLQKRLGIDNNHHISDTTIVESRVLTWGLKEEYPSDKKFDIIIGSDIVTTLYDPYALAQTLYDLSSENTRIYLSAKSRLDQPHRDFEEAVQQLFHNFVKLPCESSRNICPNIFIIEISRKKEHVSLSQAN